jgi:hypothetical protein
MSTSAEIRAMRAAAWAEQIEEAERATAGGASATQPGGPRGPTEAERAAFAEADVPASVADDPAARALAVRMASLDAVAWNALRLAERRLTAGDYERAERALVRALAAVAGVVDLEGGR